MSPRESLIMPPSLPPPTPLPGAETRRRKARRRALEGGLAPEANQEAKELQGSSDAEVGGPQGCCSSEASQLNSRSPMTLNQERLVEELKMEDAEEGEVDDHGLAISVRRVRLFSYFTID